MHIEDIKDISECYKKEVLTIIENYHNVIKNHDFQFAKTKFALVHQFIEKLIPYTKLSLLNRESDRDNEMEIEEKHIFRSWIPSYRMHIQEYVAHALPIDETAQGIKNFLLKGNQNGNEIKYNIISVGSGLGFWEMWLDLLCQTNNTSASIVATDIENNYDKKDSIFILSDTTWN